MLPSNAAKSKLTFTEIGAYLAVAVKHLRLAVLAICFTLMVGITYYVFARPIYYCKSKIVLHVRPGGAIDDQQVYQESSLRELLDSTNAPWLVERTATRLGLPPNVRIVQDRYVKKFKSMADSDGNLDVEVWAITYPLTESYTRTLLAAYLEDRDEKRRAHAEAVMRSYAEDMARVKQKMDDYRRKSLDSQLDPRFIQAMRDLEEVSMVPFQLTDTRRRLQQLTLMFDELKNPGLDVVSRLALTSREKTNLEVGQMVADGSVAGGNAGRTVVVPSLLTPVEAPWQKLDAAKRELEARRASLERVYLPGNRKVREVQEEIRKVTEDLQAELDHTVERLSVERARLTSLAERLDSDVLLYKQRKAAYDKFAQDSAQEGASWIKGLDKMYSGMLNRLDVISFGGDVERLKYECITKQINEKPVSPNRFKLLLYSLIAGIALALALPFLLEYLDNTIQVLDQAEETLGVRGLGIVPLVKAELGHDAHSVLIGKTGSRALNETFRVIRTNLIAGGQGDEGARVLLVTSTVPREGKSMVSANMALSFAQTGQRVILVDADIHRGTQHRQFGVSSKPGLMDYLVSGGEIPIVVALSKLPNLSLLPCGRHHKHAGELVGSPRFAELVASLRGKFDRVIIDAPPVLGLAETPALLPLVDSVVFVIWSGFTPMPQVKTAVKMLTMNGAKSVGCILNRLDMSSATGYYYYYYYSNYYYSSYKLRLPAATAGTGSHESG